MNALYSFIISISMYSKIPMPQVNWKKERMAYVMGWFPAVGLAIGGLLWLWQWLGGRLGFSVGFVAMGAAAIPLLVTGGIHMDGFLDTTDALHSYGDREKKLEILKDPHVGAFAVIGCGIYLLLYGGAACQGATQGLLGLLGPVFVLERSLSGLSVVYFPCAKKSGLAATFSDGSKKQAAACMLTVWLLVSLVWLFFTFGGIFGLMAAAGVLGVQLLVWWHYYRISRREFGGITGDLAGYFLQLAELASLLVLVFFRQLQLI